MNKVIYLGIEIKNKLFVKSDMVFVVSGVIYVYFVYYESYMALL